MFRPLVRSHRRPPRRGTAILITCFFLITIMMVTGLALVMYAAREKAAALAYQEGASTPVRSLPNPDATVNHFLSSLIYGPGDGELPNNGGIDPNSLALQNSLRGNEIARSMYGSRSDYSVPANPWGGSTTPWAGVGVFHETVSTYPTGSGAGTFTTLGTTDRAQAVNQTALLVNGQPFLLDPEWTGNRVIGSGNPLPPFSASLATNPLPFPRNYVGKHAGYTYPDLKNFWLGARDPATGEVLVQSFHRDWMFRDPDTAKNANRQPLHPDNINWSNDAGKLLTLRPRPAEHPRFPRVPPNADGSYSGDVQNLPGSFSYNATTKQFGAKNDSLWMHIGLPKITLSDGRPVQPLVAALILPLDGSFDLSIHGNQLGAPPAATPTNPTPKPPHISSGGYGPWAINIGYGLTSRTVTPPPALTSAQDNDRFNLLAQRTASRIASEFSPFVNSQVPTPPTVQQLLPRYSPVSWSGALVNFRLPSQQVAPDNRYMLGLPSSGDASYSGGAYGNFQNDNGQIPNHPAGYNSNEFGVRNNTLNLNSPVYPFTDLKRLALRYAFYPDWYSQAFVTKTAPATFLGDSATYPFFANTTAGMQTKYRLDPAHALRGLWVPRAMSLERPALAPNFPSRDTTATGNFPALALGGGGGGPNKPGPLLPIPTSGTPTAYPSPQAPGVVTDFGPSILVGGGNTTQQWLNIQAALGSVDLNRPLADYRADVTKALLPDPTKLLTDPVNSNVTAASAAQADADRQALARDIFARLIVTTGAAGQVNLSTGAITLPDPATRMLAGVTYSPEQYNALRYLAQLAVNIVDYIDNDDISTTFVWNPSGDLSQDLLAANVGNRVVFGVEKPKLLLNEVYSEITNDPADKVVGDPDKDGNPIKLDAMAKAHIRFWAELVNPTSAPHTAATGVLGTGSVPLSAYQIQIARANRTTGGAEDRASFLSMPGNTTGRFGDAAGTVTVPDATFTFLPIPVAPAPSAVSPNDVSLGAQQYAPPQANLPAGGFVLVGPKSQSPAKTDAKEFNPPTTGVWAPANKVDSPDLADAGAANVAMGYRITMPAATALSTAEFKRHVVLLRRLTNPYLPVNDPNIAYDSAAPLNPYITVDVMDYVPAFDAVHRAANEGPDRKERNTNTNPNGFDPVIERFSVGKVQPLAGLSVATITEGAGKYNVYNGNTTWVAPTAGTPAPLTNSMVRDQVTPAPATNTNNEPKHTLGRHNGNSASVPATVVPVNTAVAPATLADTIMFPFDWQIHMDRPLETLGDVFFVRDCPPHRLTTEFVQPSATAPSLNYTVSSARWTQHSDGLARALSLLSVKSHNLRDAHGGRVGGKVNPNVVQDRRIVQGVWDPQSDDRFNIDFVNGIVWDKWMQTRSPLTTRTMADGVSQFTIPGPSSSVLDLTAGGVDRPFQPYGAPSITVGSTGTFAYTAPNTTNDGDTILRRPLPTTTPLNPNPEPYLVLDPQADSTVIRHPYTQTEPLRKVMNNLTTVSHTFVVYLTIGYFDVTMTTPAGYPSNINGGQVPQFGAEVYDQIPGDMRQKYIAVIDMSNMALKANPPANDLDPHATGQPFFTALTATARPSGTPATTPVALTLANGGGDGTTFTIPTDGQTATVQVTNPPTQLVLGYGLETQVVTVDAIGPQVPGGNYPSGLAPNQIGVLNLTRNAWGGTCLSNVRPGYAGPRQPGEFNYNSAKYKPVVPYVERLK